VFAGLYSDEQHTATKSTVREGV